MSTTVAALIAVGSLAAVLAVVHAPFGDYLARVYSSSRHLRVERGVYRLTGVDPDREHITGRVLGFLGEPAVSVLPLNSELDRIAPVGR